MTHASFSFPPAQPTPRIVVQEPDAVAAWAERWLAVFGADRRGIGAQYFLWHIFSNDRYPSVCGHPAYDHYARHAAPEYIVLTNDRKHAVAVDCRPDVPPFSSFNGWTDFYVFPTNLAWTLARTHEEIWLGPYFARHPDYDALNRENLVALEKARMIREARGKGWL
ncbi:DUF4275 family protein [Robbsia sp. Bb-Pol-6]|uniref:DUF4275 family protein n=1 Tax=Robbsia betulipollinis TaxID=2981849 RepID=A0ABT3ZTG0_9BURK|nr:DUF4275 family protein [Robbsia betulipollinis]MCY0389854.1 DUF4275 family protein [Robbsia betulipollinis]